MAAARESVAEACCRLAARPTMRAETCIGSAPRGVRRADRAWLTRAWLAHARLIRAWWRAGGMATDLGRHTAEAAAAPADPTQRRLRLGFLTHLHVGKDAADSYRIALDLFEAAEQMGYDSGWVAQHHFLNGDARMPSSLTFLAAAAQRTRTINLGTAIIILPLEDPLRVAEDAAVLDTLSG